MKHNIDTIAWLVYSVEPLLLTQHGFCDLTLFRDKLAI